MRSKAQQLRGKLKRGTVVLVGAHDGITAKLVAKAGFDGVWASGFEISSAHGVPDASILSMEESLASAKAIASSVPIPMIADCDSGYGTVENTAKMTKAYEAIGAAGICIEDNPFPKRNSFYPGKRKLVSPEEHAARIAAAKGAQKSKHFMVIARTEAFIAGLGLKEALKRAYCYEEAGADAILVHSKAKTPDEIFSFAKGYGGSLPLVCVPTSYNRTNVKQLADGGYRMVIYANYVLRTAVAAIIKNLEILKQENSAYPLEGSIVPMGKINELVGYAPLKHLKSGG